MFNTSDVDDFSNKIIASNRKTFPKVEVRLECTEIAKSTKLPSNVEIVHVDIHFETEENGDSKHLFPDQSYDPKYMVCRVRSEIILFSSTRKIKGFEHTTYTKYPLLKDTTTEDIMIAIDKTVANFILPKLLELGLSISKDNWVQP